MSKLICKLTFFIAITVFVVGVGASLIEPIAAQNMTGNQSGNQTVGPNLLPPRVVGEDTQAEIFGGQQ
jgi:hypothetical protein